MSKHVYLIAGEASGDALGGKLMSALSTHGVFTWHGVGGEKMRAQGLQSFFPMEELSLLGFLEIIPHIPKLLKRIEATADDIIAKNPDMVITIDAPAFTRRVAKKLREKGAKMPLVHYVAPSVWAYKPKRAAKVAKLYAHLLCLLPFEPPYFEREGLAASFVGHPITENPPLGGNRERFFKAHNIVDTTPLLGILAGSRSGELKRHIPVLQETVKLLAKQMPELQLVLFATPRFAETLRQTPFDLPSHVVVTLEDKADAMASISAALAKSGTGTLEFALANVPIAVFYKVNPVSAYMLRKMIQIQFVNLINILENQPIISEWLQEECTPEILAGSAISLLTNQNLRETQLVACKSALQKLYPEGGLTPSQKAADIIINLLNK